MGNPIQYRDSHYKGKTVIRPSYLYDGDPLLVRWHLYIETAFLFIKEYFLWDFRHQVEKHHKHIWRIWKLTYMKHPKFNTSTLLFFKDALYFQSILFSYIHLFLFSNIVNSSRPGDPYGITKFGQYWFNTLRPRQQAAVSQTLSNAFSWSKMLEFRFRFHWSLFLRVQLTIIQHWFR